MTTLVSSLSTDTKGWFAAAQARSYFVNDFDPMKVWNPPKATADSAGIAAPAAAIGATTSTGAGNSTNGAHYIRYRYKNSKTGYISNPSAQATVTVAGGNGLLTYNIGGGGPIVASADGKVDQIVVEMTPVNSPTFYVATTALNSAGSLTVNTADSSLIQLTNVTATYGDFGHEAPPLVAVLVSHRGRLFGFGSTTRTRTSTTFSNGSTTVTGTNFSTSWAGRLIRAASSAVAYEISSVASTVSMTLTTAFAESTVTNTATVFSKFPNRGYWTRTLYPESWKVAEYARDFLQNRADQIVGACSYGPDIYVFGTHSSERFSYSIDPAVGDGQISPVPGDRGVFNQRCLLQADGNWYAWDRQGIYQVTPGGPQQLSGSMDPLLLSMVDFSQSDSFHACYEPIDRLLCFYFTRSGDTQPKYAAVMEKDTGKWYLHQYYFGVTGSGVVATTDGQVRMMVGDENGYTWFAGVEGGFDGVPPTSSAVLNTSGSPTRTSITVTQTLPTGTTTLAGVVAYDPSTGNTSVVSSNTASVLTMTGTGFATAPTSGQELWLGVIPVDITSKWITAPSLDSKKRPSYVTVHLYPGTATGKLRVYYYLDFATSPYVWTAGTSDTFPDGVTVTSGASYASIDLDAGSADGQVSVPVPGEFWRALKVRMTSDRPDGTLRILGWQLGGGDQKLAVGE